MLYNPDGGSARPPRRVPVKDSLSVAQDDTETVPTGLHQTVPTTAPTDNGKKRSRTSDLSSSELDTDNEKNNSRRSEAAKGPRQARKQSGEREAELDADKWVRSYDTHEVECEGCRRIIRLHKTRNFDLTNWKAHRRTCSHITGTKRIRIVTFKDGKMGYSTKEVAAVWQYHHCLTAKLLLMHDMQTPSVKMFFPAVPHSSTRLTVASTAPCPSTSDMAAVPVSVTCVHLRGGVYAEYISRTQTRSLGGVSPKLRGRITRQVFPYKPFAPLNNSAGQHPQSRRATPASPMTTSDLPDESNIECEEKKWTDRERNLLDDTLKGWARWSVDFGRGFVRSARCEGTTTNKTSICDACEHLASKDAGLKKSLSRVGAFLLRLPYALLTMSYSETEGV